MVQRDLERLHAAHRQAGHGAVVAVRDRAVGRVDERDEGLRHVVLERLGHVLHGLPHLRRAERLSGQVGRDLAGAPRVAVGHHDDHRLAASRRDQVVEDEVRASLADPAGLVLAAAVLQVEHRVARLRLLVVVRREVDERVAPGAGHLRVVPDLAHLAVRHVLDVVVVDARLGDLDGARVLAAAEERVAALVVHLDAVDDQRVVVQAGRERRRRDRPDAVRLLHHVHLRPAPEVQADLRGLGSLEADLHSPGAVDARILGSPDVGRRGLEVDRLLGGADACRGTDTRGEKNGQSNLLHLCLLR